jgi:polar amino acid transport system substrate-binding protein
MKNHQKELSELNKMLEQKAKKYQTIASTDALTGLYNRHKLDELFDLEMYSMQKKENPLCMAIVDIDFFKKINDTYGHEIGDVVLVGLSNFLLQQLRSTDIIARWGGEEFVLLLNSVNIDNAYNIVDKIREKLSQKEFDKVGKVTISAGVTNITQKDSFTSAFARADKALYQSKKDGRNRVTLITKGD